MSTLRQPGPRQSPERLAGEPDARPEPAGAPAWSPWSILIAGLLATGASTFVLGQWFSWPFGLMFGFGVAAITACVAWGAAHPPDPFDD